MAADIPRDIAALHKAIREARVEGSEDLHQLTEFLRAYLMDVSETIDLAEYEIRSALTWYDRGRGGRARQVTRPLRHAQSMVILAARRSVAAYKAYQKAFAGEIDRNRSRSGRRFDPEK